MREQVNPGVCGTFFDEIVTRTSPQIYLSFCKGVKDPSLIARVVARFASASLAKGDILTVWMKRGDWWSEMRRGVKLEVKDIQGDTIRVTHQGVSTSGWEMKLPTGQDLSKRFKLEGNAKFNRSLVVEKG